MNKWLKILSQMEMATEFVLPLQIFRICCLDHDYQVVAKLNVTGAKGQFRTVLAYAIVSFSMR